MQGLNIPLDPDALRMRPALSQTMLGRWDVAIGMC